MALHDICHLAKLNKPIILYLLKLQIIVLTVIGLHIQSEDSVVPEEMLYTLIGIIQRFKQQFVVNQVKKKYERLN